MTPFDAYKQYLAFKNHFSKLRYDYYKYSGKSNASIESFNKRKDKYFFEKLSRQKSDDAIISYYIANFIESNDPSSLWIGEIIQNGESHFNSWQSRNQSLKYRFEQEVKYLFDTYTLKQIFEIKKNNHPVLMKEFFKSNICIETLVIFEKLLSFCKNFDINIQDPIWEGLSLKIKKYEPFLNIIKDDYQESLKEIVKGHSI